ncbi:MAG TPA: hypothetical protein VLX56_08300 [Nitrososphaerales archaeon]|nr:hypothetical protein [Nitrososphaerales archaeon]
MSSRRKARLVVAELLAVLALLLAMLYTARFYDPSIPSIATYTGAGTSILAIVFAVAAFLVSLRIRSPPIAGMLVVGGILMLVPPLQAIAEAGAVVVPGPILGVVFFAPILILGLVKAVGSKTKATKNRTAGGGYSVAVSTLSLGADKPNYRVLEYKSPPSTLRGRRHGHWPAKLHRGSAEPPRPVSPSSPSKAPRGLLRSLRCP